MRAIHPVRRKGHLLHPGGCRVGKAAWGKPRIQTRPLASTKVLRAFLQARVRACHAPTREADREVGWKQTVPQLTATGQLTAYLKVCYCKMLDLIISRTFIIVSAHDAARRSAWLGKTKCFRCSTREPRVEMFRELDRTKRAPDAR